MKTKLTTLLLLVFVLASNAQFRANLQLKDFEVKSKDVVAMKETYVTHVKVFGSEFSKNYTFNADGYLTSNENNSKITYQNSYEKVTMTSKKDNKISTYYFIKTPVESYLADTKQVKTNTNGAITDIFFKSNDGKYDSNLRITYAGELIMTKPDVDYLFLNIYTDKGLLLKELNLSMGNYYNAYDAKTNLKNIRVFSMKNDDYDLYTLYLYEFDVYGNWIVKYEFESFPTLGNKLDNLKRIEVREFTFKNGTKTGYSTVSQDIKNKGLAKISTLVVEKLDKGKFPIYYDLKTKAVTNNQVISSDPKCEGDCQNGWGYYTFDNGYYDGFWENGKKNGYGVYGWKNGEKYFGFWRDDKMNDFGQIQFTNGNEYVGSFLNGKYHGNALYYEKDKNSNQYNKYEDGKYVSSNSLSKNGSISGCVAGDCFNGYGAKNFPDGIVYIGDFKEGGFHKGIYYFTNGDTYQGMFNYKNNKFEGFGFLFYKDSEDFYKGTWLDGKQSGNALSYVKGVYYKNKWKEGKVIKSY